MTATLEVFPMQQTPSHYSKLFMAVLKRRMDAVFSQVSGALPLDPPIEDTLRHFGAQLLRSALSKAQIALLRMVGMESRRFPKLGAYFYELSPKRGLAHLSGYLEESRGANQSWAPGQGRSWDHGGTLEQFVDRWPSSVGGARIAQQTQSERTTGAG
jgi:hypothetical protein